MKTAEELNALKKEVETVNKKLHELTEEEQKQIFGGAVTFVIENDESPKEFTIYKNELKEFEG